MMNFKTCSIKKSGGSSLSSDFFLFELGLRIFKDLIGLLNPVDYPLSILGLTTKIFVDYNTLLVDLMSLFVEVKMGCAT